ncbi:MAG: bile acid:sodium symporter [Acidobacteria bacterium]|nr:bile acid:sodium symporter [Acidobacteriota bacterium]
MNTAVQITVFLMMTVVGLDLTTTDFRRLGENPRIPVAATVLQWILLPIAAWAVAWLLPLPGHIFAGMILLAASPAGGISNYYSYLARADVALSVSLTAVSTLASALTLPLIATVGFRLFLVSEPGFNAPFGVIASQLVFVILVPVALGMGIRHLFPDFAIRHELKVRRASEVLLLATVTWLVIGLRHTLLDDLGMTALAIVVFTALALGSGFVVGKIFGADKHQLLTLMIEFPCRNTAITIMVGIAVLGLPRLAAFALAFLIVQMALFFAGITAARFRASSSGLAGCSD